MTNGSKNETKSKRPTPIGCVLYSMLAFVLLATFGYFFIQNANSYSALDATREWARLNEFPSSATNLTVETQGNMFTREFTIEFDAPIKDIEKWLNESPGTNSVTPTINGNVRRYDIEPGGGAGHAELEIDDSNGHVRINTYWS